MVMHHGDTDFSKLVNLCLIKIFSHISTPAPPSFWGEGGGLNLQPNFQKEGGGCLTGSQFLVGGCWERGGDFFQVEFAVVT